MLEMLWLDSCYKGKGMMCQCAPGFLLPFLDLLSKLPTLVVRFSYLFCSVCDLIPFSAYSLNSAFCWSLGHCPAPIGIVAIALDALRTVNRPCSTSVAHNMFICGLSHLSVVLELRWASLRRISDVTRYRTLWVFLGNVVCFYNKGGMFYFFVSNADDE